MNELCLLTATALRARIDSRSVSCHEVLTAFIDHIEITNPPLNAIVTTAFEQAVEQAKRLDQRIHDGEQVGPLAGLPIAHKDLVATKGIRTTFGSPLFADNVPAEDALIVTRLRDADAITVGKTNTPEFGAGSQTFNRVFGATKNPYDQTKTCGGSSGGAAAALSARMIPIADGSDTGGSLRNPAAFCNVVGFRPSPGRVPGGPNPWNDLSTAGPMARTVDDVALLFSVLAGPLPTVPNVLPESGASFRQVEPMDPKTLKIGFTEDFGALPVDRPVREALRRFAAELMDAGVRIEEISPDFSDAARIFHILRANGFRARFGAMSSDEQAQLKDTIRWNLDAGKGLRVQELDWVPDARMALIARMATLFESYDLILGPTTQVLPFDLTTDWVREVEGKAMTTYIEWMEACSFITVTCSPALSIPAGFENGLPVGAQLVAPLRDDAGLLRAAKAIEEIKRHSDTLPSPL